MSNKLYFISRHEPNNGQIAVAKELGFDGIEQRDIKLHRHIPEKELERNGIFGKTIAIVAPINIKIHLLNRGYTLIEFLNSSVKREKNAFCCKAALKYNLKRPAIDNGSYIEQEYWACPIPLEEQIESSLQLEKRGA